MIYELRTYDIVPGKLPAMNDRMAKRTIPLFHKHGIKVTGMWIPEFGEKVTHRLVYMLAYDSMADRERKWGAFLEDPEVHHMVAETEGDTPWTLRAQSTILRPTPYSPLP